MNTFTKRLLGLALGGMILGACSQTATFEEADLMNEQAVEKAGFKLSPFSSGGGENFKVSDTETVYTNATFNVAVTAYNDCENTYFTITRTGGSVMTVRVAQPGIASTQTNGSTILDAGTTVTTTVPHLEGWEDGDDVTISYYVSGLGGGSNNKFQSGIITYNLVDVCSDCDIEGNEFTGDAVSCAQTGREAVYTFGSEEGLEYFKMQGGLNNFTGGNASVYINDGLVDFNTTSVDGWATGTVGSFTVGQRTPGGSLNRNIRVEGGLGTCEEVVVRIVWNSSNAGSTITGSWSVEDAQGIELAPEVADLSCD